MPFSSFSASISLPRLFLCISNSPFLSRFVLKLIILLASSTAFRFIE
ncbi:hypothetical protein CSUI_004192 [Cystoisospora suis]|uniref:Uncharacterized protein n=1 Tax=Cystoisospora suis TaxID=483139 RepID=A0A2C6L2L5_9APIC|nr:hypothetical protein CSUI_004192 [Cystoisospora suis]